jgi:molybdate transport system substrate-binding protein
MNLVKSLISMLVLTTTCTCAWAKDLTVFCAGAVKPVFSVLEPAWVARGGPRIQVTYGPAGDLTGKLAAGERPDIVILPRENLDSASTRALVDAASRRDLGAVGIGVAVRAGASVPDVSSEEGLKRALQGARSVTYMDPARGTSGRYFDEVVLPKLAIRDEVRAKTQLGEGGMIAEKVARGEVDLAIQQMTELVPVAGIVIAGALPPSLQKITVYSGAVMKSAQSPAEAAKFLEFLASAEGQQVFMDRGFALP